MGSDSGIVSPIVPFSLQDGNSLQSPIVQTSDSKQWIDLDYMSPKLLKELRRQYDPSLKDEPSGPLAKGAAKVKAWARQSKLGIDIRLRRRINADHDEVTDIRLVPDPGPQQTEWQDEKVPQVAELPGAQNEINEMPDSSVPPELDAVQLPSRTSTISSTGEPLPRYEPGSYMALAELVGDSMTRPESPEWARESTSSPGSINATPTMGASVQDVTESTFSAIPRKNANLQAQLEHPRSQTSELMNLELGVPQGLVRTGAELDSTYGSLDSEYGSHAELLIPQGTNVENLKVRQKKIEEKLHGMTMKNPRSLGDVLDEGDSTWKLRDDLDETMKKLREERQVSESLQAVIEAIRGSPSTGGHQRKKSEHLEPAKSVLGRLKVVNTTTCETETDAEPLSPTVQRRVAKPGRKKSTVTPKRKTSSQKSKFALTESLRSGLGSDDEGAEQERSLLRKQTLPRRMPPSAGAEAIWSALLRAQSKILGPEHPLVYQAKSDLARSRANGHAKGSEDLSALRQSKTLAIETLGTVHPWVATFLQDLRTLESLTGASEGSQTSVNDEVGAKVSECLQRENPTPSPIPGTTKVSPPTQSPTNENNMVESGSERRSTLPRITTSFHGRASESSPPPPNMDGFWNTWRPPHKPKSNAIVLGSFAFDAAVKMAMNGLAWLQRSYGPEQPVEPGKVRVRWTCGCGERIYDDFTEERPGAARELEAYLNRPRMHTRSPTSPGSSNGKRYRSNSMELVSAVPTWMKPMCSAPVC